MTYDEYTILRLAGVITLGILLFDLWLLAFNKKMTISRSVVQIGKSKPWIAIGICAAICFLIAHFFTDFL